MKRFLSFARKLELSTKPAVRHLFGVIKRDVQSITGSNIRKILDLLKKEDLSQIAPMDTLALNYHPISEDNLWRIKLLKELIDLQHGELTVNLTPDEIQHMVIDICTA